jgi:hypothetical protein
MLLTSPDLRKAMSTWSRNALGICWRAAISLLAMAPWPCRSARSRMARTPYSLFMESFMA